MNASVLARWPTGKGTGWAVVVNDSTGTVIEGVRHGAERLLGQIPLAILPCMLENTSCNPPGVVTAFFKEQTYLKYAPIASIYDTEAEARQFLARIVIEAERQSDNAVTDAKNARARLAALLSAAPQQAGGWLPIEQADKKKPIIALTKTGLRYFARYRYGVALEPSQDTLAWRCDSSGTFSDPVYFMPANALPLPPSGVA